MRTITLDDFAKLLDGGTGRVMGPDGVVRFPSDISDKEKVADFVKRTNEFGAVCAAFIFAPGNKKLRVAVYPKTLELPKPICKRACTSREDAQLGVDIGMEKFPDKYVRYFEVAKDGRYIREKDGNPADHYFARYDTPTDHYSVEVWEPWDFLRLGLYPCWTVEEIVDQHRQYGFKGAGREMALQEQAQKMTASKKTSKKKLTAKHIEAFLALRAELGEDTKKWVVVEELATRYKAKHPRKKGWSSRSIWPSVKGIK